MHIKNKNTLKTAVTNELFFNFRVHFRSEWRKNWHNYCKLCLPRVYESATSRSFALTPFMNKNHQNTLKTGCYKLISSIFGHICAPYCTKIGTFVANCVFYNNTNLSLKDLYVVTP